MNPKRSEATADVHIGGKAVWINVSLLGGVLLTTGMGVWRFASIEHSVDKANLSLANVVQTVGKIEIKLDSATSAIGQQSNGLAVLRARMDTIEAELRRQDTRGDAIESRVRALEQKVK